MSLVTTISAGIRALLTGSADHGTPTADLLNSFSAALATGTGAGQADRVFDDQRTLAASSNETLDLTALTDALGAAVSFVKVKAILIKAAAANANNVVVGNGAMPFVGPFDDGTATVAIPPGGALMLVAPVAGWAVANGVSDNLKIANSGAGTPVTYDITIVGTSA